MMPECHQLDSSCTMSEQQESMKKKTLKSSSRSFLFSTGLSTFWSLIFRFDKISSENCRVIHLSREQLSILILHKSVDELDCSVDELDYSVDELDCSVYSKS